MCPNPLWVRRGDGQPNLQCLLHPRKRTSLRASRMSALCHNRTHALQQKGLLIDHLVGARKHGPGNGKAERFGSLEVDYQFELGRLLDREFGRSRAL
jgi:hypothetical protein